MTKTQQYQEHIHYTFNAFCKVALYHATRNAYMKLQRKQQFDVSLDYLREFHFEPVVATDGYFVKYDVPAACTLENGIYFSCQHGYSDGEKVCIYAACGVLKQVRSYHILPKAKNTVLSFHENRESGQEAVRLPVRFSSQPVCQPLSSFVFHTFLSTVAFCAVHVLFA